jgi:hypothetical protein
MFGDPAVAVIVGSMLSLLMNLSPALGALVLWSRGLPKSSEAADIILLGSVLYLGLFMITLETRYTSIHVNAPAIALMLWGVIFYAKWWATGAPSSMEYLRSSSRCRNWAVRGKKRYRLHGRFSTGPRTAEGKARTIAAMVEGRRRLLEKLKAEGKPVPWGGKRGGVNRSAAERQLAQASKQHARAQRDLKEFLSQKFRRQRRQAREVAKGETELAEHEEQRRRLRLLPLSPEQREALPMLRPPIRMPGSTARVKARRRSCASSGMG